MGDELDESGIANVTKTVAIRCRCKNIPKHLRDDCVQESLKIAVVVARKYPTGDFPTMVWRCVQRGVANAMRDWFGHKGQKPQACGLLIETRFSNDPTYAEVDIRLTVDTIIASAPPKDARILAEFRDNDLNYRQVAYRLGYTKAQVSHAIERTRECWGR